LPARERFLGRRTKEPPGIEKAQKGAIAGDLQRSDKIIEEKKGKGTGKRVFGGEGIGKVVVLRIKVAKSFRG